jgi:hypothetical protein
MKPIALIPIGLAMLSAVTLVLDATVDGDVRGRWRQ